MLVMPINISSDRPLWRLLTPLIKDSKNKDKHKIFVTNSHFKSHNLNERRSYKEGVPKAHYTFEFDSVYNPNVPGTILLDILFDSPHYPELIESSVEISWVSVAEPVTSITTPSINAICGDKLTAFAPETVGIPYYKGDRLFTMEICKQLFDLGKLFEKLHF